MLLTNPQPELTSYLSFSCCTKFLCNNSRSSYRILFSGGIAELNGSQPPQGGELTFMHISGKTVERGQKSTIHFGNTKLSLKSLPFRFGLAEGHLLRQAEIYSGANSIRQGAIRGKQPDPLLC